MGVGNWIQGVGIRKERSGDGVSGEHFIYYWKLEWRKENAAMKRHSPSLPLILTSTSCSILALLLPFKFRNRLIWLNSQRTGLALPDLISISSLQDKQDR
jgi:hypothetical protein